MIGSILLPLNSVIYHQGDPLDLSSYTVKFQMEGETSGTSKIAETATGVSKHPTQAFTADATTNLLTCVKHGVKAGDQIVVANSGGSLPTGLAASARYFAVDVTPNAFGLATLPNGPKIDITGAGTGTHTFYVVGSVSYTFLAAGVDTAGRYAAWWTIYTGSDFAAAPVARQGFIVEIVSFGN